MARPLRFPVAAWLGVALAAGTVRAQSAPPPPRSAPISDVRYELTVDSAAVGSHNLGVVMTFTVRGPAPVLLSLPAWSPGHYVLLWFARRVSHFAAEQGGAPLAWGQTDFQTWRIVPRAAGRVSVSFQYLADTIDRAVAWTQPNFSFFLGTNLFLYPVGRGFAWPATVTVRTEPSWRIATGMAPGSAPDVYSADNYHDLTDMPFFVGRFDLDSTLIADRWIRLAWYPAGSLTTARRDRTFGWLRQIVPAEVAVFDEAPFRNYTIFMVSDTVVNGGGLEHQSSQMDETTTNQLDSPGLPGLYAHEFFHAWNVKRLRPADMVPYRYDDAQPTRWLWVSEGVTSYYGSLAQVRGGIKDSAGFYQDIANTIAQVLSTPPTALGDASLGSWINPTDGSGGIYYAKGELAGFLLDVLIRDGSDNRHSLDHLMRDLYVSTYKRGRGFTPADWWAAAARNAGGRSFTEFARRYVDGRDAFPYDSVLPLAGLRLVADSVFELRFGITEEADSGEARITEVFPGGAAAAAGIQAGDRIVAIGEVRVSDDASFAALRNRYAGTTQTSLPVVLRRSGQLLALQAPVRLFPRARVRVVVDPGASARAVRIRQGIVSGTVDR
ncbi:MAG: PDZ domain-containing protein [Gemmatimonadales bacterium]